VGAAPNHNELQAAYEGLEASFSTDAERDNYRAALLERSGPQADFVAARVVDGSVLEVGCGNGRLLVQLALRGQLGTGHGVDRAQSRIRFAREWAQDLRLERLRFEAADALELSLEPSSLDAVICITGTFAYFDPFADGSAAALAQRWRRALRPDGWLVLELYPHPELIPLLEVAHGEIRLWRELEPSDPWRYYLSHLQLLDGVLIHDKTFIHRTTGHIDGGRRERLKLYTSEAIEEVLDGAEFCDIKCYEGWTRRRYAGGRSMVVTARPRASH
jgi:SAM-dependent methyltransferase